jgi:biotin-(acetyl-CoA carboxylase) ligase
MKDIIKQGMNLSRRPGARNANQLNGFVILILVALALMYGLIVLSNIVAVISLFVASLIGIGVNMKITKPEISPEDILREQTIKQYKVPNTKEALLEFTILASEKIRPISPIVALYDLQAKRQIWINKIWQEKCATVYTRARLAMKDDPGSLAEITRLITKMGVKV